MNKEEIKKEIMKGAYNACMKLPLDPNQVDSAHFTIVVIPMVKDIVIQYTHYLSMPSSLSRSAQQACDTATGLMDALWFACCASKIMSREKFMTQVGSMFYDLCYPISRMVRDSDDDIWLLDLEKEEGLC